LVALQLVPELPRSPIGKVLKRDLRDAASQAPRASWTEGALEIQHQPAW